MNLEERWQFLGAKERRVDPGFIGAGDNAARVLDAVEHKRGVVAVKTFTFDKVEYRPGDPFPAQDVAPAKLARLGELRMLRCENEFTQAKAHREIEDFISHLSPQMQAVTQARRVVPQAEAMVVAARAALKDAESRLRDAVVIRDQREQELADALAGPNVDELLAKVDAAIVAK